MVILKNRGKQDAKLTNKQKVTAIVGPYIGNRYCHDATPWNNSFQVTFES